ncbi:hypothetical protein HX082_12240 [Myroides odoratimimus]|uniref:hypothetical protein n=1 Tax=Myroides odoratimimus TaxID=76832 RepID=UPI0025790EFE|nr:hypothetical protein [Myroides odoratimimus]MDM1510164.1 hypothetical protein [Myroides odoratimimus]
MEDFEKKIDGYKFNYNNIHCEQGDNYQTIILDNRSQFKKSLKYILEKKINQVEIRHELDENDIKALLTLESIPLKGLSIENSRNKGSLSFLNELVSLEYLIITSQQVGIIDFKELVNLKEFNSSSQNIELKNLDCASNLVRLSLQNYNDKDLPVLKSTNLKFISIYFSDIKTLNFLSKCSKIEYVRIEKASNLLSINELGASKDTIKELLLTKCSKFQDYSILGSLSNLDYLRILKCGSMKTTLFLEKLSSLRYGNIDIDIEDGNVNNILDKPIIFKYYKHFSAKSNYKVKLGIDGLTYLYKGKNVLYSI